MTGERNDASAAEPDEEAVARRKAAARAAVEAYRRTLRNESASERAGSGAPSGDERYLADRPPHWAPPSWTVNARRRQGRPDGEDTPDTGAESHKDA